MQRNELNFIYFKPKILKYYRKIANLIHVANNVCNEIIKMLHKKSVYKNKNQS